MINANLFNVKHVLGYYSIGMQNHIRDSSDQLLQQVRNLAQKSSQKQEQDKKRLQYSFILQQLSCRRSLYNKMLGMIYFARFMMHFIAVCVCVFVSSFKNL